VAELTLDPTETVRVRLERALASEEVNLASEAGRARSEQLIEETLRSYEAEALSGQAPPLAAEQRTAIAAERETSSSASARSPSGCSLTRSRRSG
jgi:hypothetical protein